MSQRVEGRREEGVGDSSMIAEAKLGSVGVGVSKEEAMGEGLGIASKPGGCALAGGRRAREAEGWRGER